MLDVGLDVHQKRSSICILDDNGKTVKQELVKGPWWRQRFLRRTNIRNRSFFVRSISGLLLALTGKQLLTYIGGMVMAGDRGSDVFTAISHRARRRMLDLLSDSERSVGDIAAHFEMSRPAVSQHLRILLNASLVTEARHGRERRYRLVPEQLGPVRDWLAQYERFWDDRLRRLAKTLAKGSKR